MTENHETLIKDNYMTDGPINKVCFYWMLFESVSSHKKIAIYHN